ncbi:Uma2 family endonuclease [Chamaesiphon sp.]|uniref:Uma2 family endonuclease n=1 Tax=Chamaesiphon sp. TaxID=2814140 RepID=UPI00359412F0
MTIATAAVDTQPLLLNISNTTLQVTPAQFDLLCIDNPDLRLELTKDRELIVMTPAFPISGKQNGTLFGRVWLWNEQTELGEVFDSSTGYDFTAIGGGKMSPDVSWIVNSRLEGISLEQFCPIPPDLAIELRSTTDRLSIQSKMIEYRRLGVRLGILVNPLDKQVEVYRLEREAEVFDAPMLINCEDVMPGFGLSLQKIW